MPLQHLHLQDSISFENRRVGSLTTADFRSFMRSLGFLLVFWVFFFGNCLQFSEVFESHAWIQNNSKSINAAFSILPSTCTIGAEDRATGENLNFYLNLCVCHLCLQFENGNIPLHCFQWYYMGLFKQNKQNPQTKQNHSKSHTHTHTLFQGLDNIDFHITFYFNLLTSVWFLIFFKLFSFKPFIMEGQAHHE